MTVSVTWSAQPYLITIPQSDLTLVGGTSYRITVNHLWQLLRDFSDSAEAAGFPTLYRRTAATASTPAITEINDPAYVAQFEDGAYSVDIINGNTNFRDVEVKNTVSVGTNNTTGFIDPQFLELGLFGDRVTIDVGKGVAGIGKTQSGSLIGTQQTPSNNIADAEAIAISRGLTTFKVDSNLTVASQDLSEGYKFLGNAPFLLLTVGPAANVTGCAAELLTVTGELDGFNTIRNCSLIDVTDVSGFIEKTAFQSTISLSGPSAFFETYSQVPGSGYPVVSTYGHNLIMRDHHGSIGFDNMTGGTHSIGVYGGRVVIEASCTGGTIHVRGEPFDIVDNSAGTVVIDECSSHKTKNVWTRLDLNAALPQTYKDDGSVISNDEFTLTKSDNGDGTFDINRT